MTHGTWGTSAALRQLLQELVSWESVTLSEGERLFPVKLKKKLQELLYFQKHPHLLALHDVDVGRKFLTALYKHPDAKQTICLISHFDTVHTEEYGELQEYAIKPEELMKRLAKRKGDLPFDAWQDLLSSDYLFGRGTMDMKMGLAIHLHLLEKATLENWQINLLLVTVPDEEVNSSGMRCAVPKLLELREEHELEYILFLNSEPVFTQNPNDYRYYFYTGTIGKLLPAVLFYGKETHAGEPLRGMTSAYMSSYLTKEMEWNRAFQETSFTEKTPLPVTLKQVDLLSEYSTQTPYRSYALYNVFLMEQDPAEVFDRFEQTAKIAAAKLNREYKEICRLHQAEPIGEVKVIRYEQLLTYTEKKHGKKFVRSVKEAVQSHGDWDEREKSIRIADQLMISCQELSPAMVILLAPPYYPAVNSSGHQRIEHIVRLVTKLAKKKFNLSMERIHYFNGLCDLSYVSYKGSQKEQDLFAKNMPVWNDSYTIPFAEMKKLDAPVLNIGPFGKDPHKRTERLHMENAFEQVPVILEEMIRMLCEK